MWPKILAKRIGKKPRKQLGTLLQRLGRKLFGGRLPFSESRPKVEKSALQVEEKGNEEPDQWSLYSQEEDYFGNFAFAEEFAEEPDYYCGLSDDCEFEGFPLDIAQKRQGQRTAVTEAKLLGCESESFADSGCFCSSSFSDSTVSSSPSSGTGSSSFDYSSSSFCCWDTPPSPPPRHWRTRTNRWTCSSSVHSHDSAISDLVTRVC